ncbi:MAG TPA: NAD-dependent protein deacetylase [Burkholderiales bacterium]|jgi:NAD-dependent SIR2 family protein deacetylase|nr:NAD-dependent protein deacetylase [Burkholderiales bacterium]
MISAAPPAASLADLASAPIESLVHFLDAHPRLQVLTGAGVSTGSGIPDYRDGDGAWKRKPPVAHQDFLTDPGVRRRYWARSLLGWPQMAAAAPNQAHAALARLGAAGHVRQLVTQNVDGLHGLAGSGDVLELHGSIHTVGCMACRERHGRAAIQAELTRTNPRFAALQGAPAPDGDADLEADSFDDFVVPACIACGGLLKPDVVFFGDSVPRARLDTAWEALADSDALLVVGSSLMVYSGYRFCLKAAELGKPVAAINLGRTRADALFALKVESACGPALQGLLDRLGLP